MNRKILLRQTSSVVYDVHQVKDTVCVDETSSGAAYIEIMKKNGKMSCDVSVNLNKCTLSRQRHLFDRTGSVSVLQVFREFRRVFRHFDSSVVCIGSNMA